MANAFRTMTSWGAIISIRTPLTVTELPVRPLNAKDKESFDPVRPSAEFADGAGPHQFTEVFFNANHTLAVVDEGVWCGNLCGNHRLPSVTFS